MLSSKFCLTGRTLELSPLIRTEGYRQHVFKWGVGTTHSLRNRLRQLPPTIPHPKEKNIEDEYFKPPAENILWCKINEQWEVYWFEFEKQNAKPFPVRKYGVERAKDEAIAFSKDLQDSGRMFARPNYLEQDTPNVFWDERMQGWFATYTDDRGVSRSAGFAASKWGFEASRLKAIERSRSGMTGEWLAKLSEKIYFCLLFLSLSFA
jgi:AP2 domain